jgi:Ni,Fe-hydrogenase III large subunit
MTDETATDVESAASTVMTVEVDCLASEVAQALGERRRLAGLFAIPDGDALRLVALLAGKGALSMLTARLAPGVTMYPALTALVPGADWYEREIHDLYGITAAGHPDLDALVLPRPAGTPPPRPGSGVEVPPLTPGADPLPALVHGDGMFTIPYGPVRSGVFEAIEYVVETPGEDIPRIQTRPHYKHRGVGAAFCGRSIEDGVLLAERVEGVASVAHAFAYCEAIERMTGTRVPLAAQYVRVLHAELERIANHLDSTIRHTEGAAQSVAYARFTLHKERILQLRARLCGSRFGRGVVVPGGVSGPPQIGDGELLGALDSVERDIHADLKLLMATPSLLDRLRGTGILPLPIVAARGALGPLGRGSGLDEDVRVSRPYGGYRQLGFTSSSREEGDALARQLVRNDEIFSSFHLVRQAVDELDRLRSPDATAWSGPIEPASGEGLGWAEAPQGEVLYLVQLENGTICQVKPRSASFHNLALFTAAFPKDITTDFAFIEASFGLSIAGVAG